MKYKEDLYAKVKRAVMMSKRAATMTFGIKRIHHITQDDREPLKQQRHIAQTGFERLRDAHQ